MRLIDADALGKTGRPVGKLMMFGGEYVYTQTEIDRAPTIDAVPVVRCRECRYNTTEKKCLNPDSIIKIPGDNDFCSYGRRREDGLYESLKRGLEEAIAYEKGEVKLRTERLSVE